MERFCLSSEEGPYLNVYLIYFKQFSFCVV